MFDFNKNGVITGMSNYVESCIRMPPGQHIALGLNRKALASAGGDRLDDFFMLLQNFSNHMAKISEQSGEFSFLVNTLMSESLHDYSTVSNQERLEMNTKVDRNLQQVPNPPAINSLIEMTLKKVCNLGETRKNLLKCIAKQTFMVHSISIDCMFM